MSPELANSIAQPPERLIRNLRKRRLAMMSANLSSSIAPSTKGTRSMTKCCSCCLAVSRQIVDQQVEDEFFLDLHAKIVHRRCQFSVPGGPDRGTGESGTGVGGGSRAVRTGVVPPGGDCQPIEEHVRDPEAAPIEIAVVAQCRAGLGQRSQETHRGGAGLAVGADH